MGNRGPFPGYGWLIGLAVVFFACRESEQLRIPARSSAVLGGPVVAAVDGEPITADEFRRALLRNGADIPGRFDSPEEKQALLEEEVIRTKLLAVAGRKAGFADDPAIVETVDRLIADKYLREVMRLNAAPAPVTDEEVRLYYDAHRAEYTPPERARASVIILRTSPGASPVERDAVRARAEQIRTDALERAATAGSFALLVREHSEDATTRERGGDLGWLPKGVPLRRIEPQLIDAIFALREPGEVGPLVETNDAFIVVRLTERSAGAVKPLAEVADDIRQILHSEKAKALSDARYRQLRERFKVEIDREALAAVGPAPNAVAAADRPPSFPVGAEPPASAPANSEGAP